MTYVDIGEEFLEHYGVKGMKWGVRKRSSPGSNSQRTFFKEGPKHLSDDVLAERIKRMETEKRYNDLNSRKVSLGQKLAAEILTNSGRTIATTVVTGGGLLVIKKVLEKKFKKKAAGDPVKLAKAVADAAAVVKRK